MSEASPIVGAALSLVSGNRRKAALKTEAAQLEHQAKQFALRGSQVAHSRRQELNEALSTIDASFASRDISGDSFSVGNLKRTATRRSQTNENAAILGEKFKEQRLLSEAAAKRRAAPFAQLAGINNAANALATPLLKAFGGGA